MLKMVFTNTGGDMSAETAGVSEKETGRKTAGGTIDDLAQKGGKPIRCGNKNIDF